MSLSVVESVNSSSNISEEEEQYALLFQCRKCGLQFRAAEKDAHRAVHKPQKRQRASSPNESEAQTLFHQVTTTAAQPPVVLERGTRSKSQTATTLELAKRKVERRAEVKKIQSIKNFNEKVKKRRFIPG